VPGSSVGPINASFDLNLTENSAEDGTVTSLSISGNAKGDNYPSTELILHDQGGNGILLGADKENGTVNNLLRKGNIGVFSFDLIINLDQDGNATTIVSGDNTYSVEEWNKMIKENFDNDDDDVGNQLFFID